MITSNETRTEPSASASDERRPDRDRIRSQVRQKARTSVRNHVKRLREDRLLSKAELARRAGLSALTIDRVESGKPCRMDTKRKILLALGLTIEEKDQAFPPDHEHEDDAP